MAKLIIDNREKYVLRHTTELIIPYETKQLTIGDFAITIDDKIFFIIERKTLEDAAASLKDGRWNNRDKLMLLREQTGCKIIMLIEGPKPDPEKFCGFATHGIQFKNIESSLFHMMYRDNIFIWWTKDTIDTAQTLCRMAKSTETLIQKDQGSFENSSIKQIISVNTPQQKNLNVNNANKCWHGSFENSSIEPNNINKAEMEDSIGSISGQQLLPSLIINTSVEPTAQSTFVASVTDVTLLTQKIPKKDIDICREMWSCIHGIAVTTADEFIKHFSIKELLAGVDFSNIKIGGGTRKLGGTLLKTLQKVPTAGPLHIKMLAVVPGISAKTSTEILCHPSLAVLPLRPPLAVLLDLPEETIAVIKVGQHGRSLGQPRAAAILRLFNYKITTTLEIKDNEIKISKI